MIRDERVRRHSRALVMAIVAAAVSTLAAPVHGQAVDDGVLLARRDLVVGSMYAHDTWDEYWEGTRKRDNQNIGTLTTRTSVWFANYGVTDRLTVLGAVPHVWTTASQGVLRSMEGFQDASFTAKYSLFDQPSSPVGGVRAIAVVSAALPLTGYTPDFYPLSIGTGSKRLSGRVTVSAQLREGWSVTGSTAFTWRAGVTLDRPYYYTDGQLFLTDEVDMPNVTDFTVSASYGRSGWLGAFAYSQQVTLGGDDIRRQDMPFVSNRMNFSRLGGLVMAPVPFTSSLAVQFAYSYIIAGRNVGQSTTLATGLVYRLPFGTGRTQ